MHPNFFLKLVYADIIGAFLIGWCFISLSFQCNYLKYFVEKKKWSGKFPLALEGFHCRKIASLCLIVLQEINSTDIYLCQLPEEQKLDLLKALAEISPYTTPRDSRQILPNVVQLLKVHALLNDRTNTNPCIYNC